MARSRLLVLLVTIACFGLIACGDSTPTSATDAGGDTTEEQPEVETEEEPEAGMPGAFEKKDCLEVAEAMGGALGGMGADPSVDFDKAIEGIRRAGDAAPEEIRDDFNVFADAMAEYLTILKDGGIDFSDPATFSTPKAQKAVKEATAVLEDPKVKEAQANIDKAMTDLCGTG
ncbi:MAG TPA: hypothetical protein VE174_00085 [Actinomycetota bacterium]|nr:hypothetical protein [Actinomycetota bacterium]